MLVFYLLLLIGSLSLGLEAMMLGMGGKIIPLYKKSPLFVLGMGTLIGFAVVVLSVAFGAVLNLEALHVCVLAFVFTLLMGKAVQTVKPQLEKEFKLTVAPLSDKDIEKILENRGIKTRKGRRR